MSVPERDDVDLPAMDPQLDRALSSWPAPRARDEFRARLREQFVTGRDEVPDAPEPVPALAAAPPRRWGSLIGVAAVVLVVLGIRWLVPPAAAGDWTVHTTVGEVLDGDRRIPVSDRDALVGALTAGRTITTGAEPLRLSSGDRFFLEIAAYSAASLRTDGALTLAPTAGTVLVATGTGFEGLEVDAPDASLSVTGTIFAVDVLDQGTCVCCLEGQLCVTGVEEPDGSPCMIEPDHAWLQGPEDEGERMEMPAAHRETLETFVAAADRLWGRR